MTKNTYRVNNHKIHAYAEDVIVDETNFYNSNSRVYVMRGIPGSGKSTFARKFVADNPNTVIVSRDAIRQNMFGANVTITSPESEDMVTVVADASIKGAIMNGNDVIVDETQTINRFTSAMIEKMYTMQADVTVVSFVVDVDTAKKRIAQRVARGGHNVPDEAIERMYARFEGSMKNPINFDSIYEKVEAIKNFAPYQCKNFDKRSAYIFDIDGTIAHMVENEEGNIRRAFDWHRVGEDAPNIPVIEVMEQVAKDNDIIVVSGRSDKSREATEAWMEKHNISYDAMYMRKHGDMRDDSIVKREIVSIIEENHGEIKGVFDDRNRVVSMWRAIGITCFQVAEGDF